MSISRDKAKKKSIAPRLVCSSPFFERWDGKRLFRDITFCASSHPITYLGATPVFIDSEHGSGTAGRSN